MRGLRGRLVAALAVLVAGAAVWYVAAPPKGSDGYRERMAEVTRSLRSQVQSARIWARTFAHGDAMSATARVGFREAESDAAAAASEFESYDPSPQDLGLRSRFVSFAAQATGEIAARLGRFERAVRP